MAQTFTKPPWAIYDFTFDWTAWLIGGDTIASVSFVVPSIDPDTAAQAINLADNAAVNYATPSPTYAVRGVTNTNTTATAFIGGGTPGQQYTVQADIVTANGRRDSRQLVIDVEFR